MNIAATVVVIVSLLVIIFSFYDFHVRCLRVVAEMGAGNLYDTAKRTASSISMQMEEHNKDIKAIAGIVGVIDPQSFADTVEAVNRFEGESVLACGPDGMADGIDLSGKDYFRRAVGGESGTALDTDGRVVEYAPFYRDGEVAGGVFAYFTVAQLAAETDMTCYGDKGYSQIIDIDGNGVLFSDHPANKLYYTGNFFDFIRSVELVNDDANSVINEITMGWRGTFTVKDEEGDENVFAFAPVGKLDWVIITTVPKEAFSSVVNEFIRISVNFFVKIGAVTCLLLLMLSRLMNSRDILKKEKAKAEVANKRYEIAMGHLSCFIFEYDADIDTITIQQHPKLEAAGIPQRIENVPNSLIDLDILDRSSIEDIRVLFQQVEKNVQFAECIVKLSERLAEDCWFKVTIENTYEGTKAIGTFEDVTEEKRAERRLAEERKYRDAMLTQAHIVFVADISENRVISLTKNAEEVELEGAVIYTDFVEGRVDRIDGADRDKVRHFYNIDNIKACFHEGMTEAYVEYKLRTSGKWTRTTMNMLSDPKTGHLLIFCYFKDITDKKNAEIMLRRQAERDALTGLYNRMYMERKVTEILDEPFSNYACAALMMIDLDKFKEVNDTYGHIEGDVLLKRIAGVLSGSFRDYDIVGRPGGDEFMVFVMNFTRTDKIIEKAEEVCRKVRDLRKENDKWRNISTSVGVCFVQQGMTYKQLYERADKALYYSKDHGRCCVSIYMENGECVLAAEYE